MISTNLRNNLYHFGIVKVIYGFCGATINIFLSIMIWMDILQFIPAFGWFSEHVTVVRYGVC